MEACTPIIWKECLSLLVRNFLRIFQFWLGWNEIGLFSHCKRVLWCRDVDLSTMSSSLPNIFKAVLDLPIGCRELVLGPSCTKTLQGRSERYWVTCRCRFVSSNPNILFKIQRTGQVFWIKMRSSHALGQFLFMKLIEQVRLSDTSNKCP